MASILSQLRRTSSISSLHARSSSFFSWCQCSRASLSQLVLQSQPSRSPRAQFSLLQSRSITTRITKSKSTSKSPPPTEVPRPILPLTNLPYFIRRTPSGQLPVYLETKAGGTRQETRLQKTEGDVDALREDLIKALGMEQNPADVVVNRLNNHIIVKGWRKPEIQQFLLERKF